MPSPPFYPVQLQQQQQPLPPSIDRSHVDQSLLYRSTPIHHTFDWFPPSSSNHNQNQNNNNNEIVRSLSVDASTLIRQNHSQSQLQSSSSVLSL
ncbi:unnamed protein product, partial [Didymodactylos carnosus]